MKTSDGFVRVDSRNLPKVDLPMLLHDNDVYNASEIREIPIEGNKCVLKAKVTPEHRIRSKMYTVSVTIDEDSETIEDIICDDCAASAGGCKHGICFAHWIIKRTEEPSVTSISCYWQKPRLSEAITSDSPMLASNIGKKRAFEKNILQLKVHIYSQMSWLIKLNRPLKTQVDSVLWHYLRQGRVTASNIYNSTRCTTANGVLVKSIMGGYKVPESRAIQRGKRLEKLIKDCGFMLVSGIIGASPDGITDTYVVEIKCPCKESTLKKYINNNYEIMDKYKAQIMLQMHATKKQKGLFCIADPKFEQNKKVYKIWVQYDEKYTLKLIEEAEKFWKQFIFNNIIECVKLG
ncbi:hypothetical protein ABMA28_017318 [Loxostege sticticalis]|uniref:YqaJ viral recombinase domain-containing protein n=1 Tax=Loxostege sticticalis TaxID=481309 RepID=A0ABD0S1U6_LOXSC